METYGYLSSGLNEGLYLLNYSSEGLSKFSNDSLKAILAIFDNPNELLKYEKEIGEKYDLEKSGVIIFPVEWGVRAEYYKDITGRKIEDDLLPHLQQLRVRDNLPVKNLEIIVDSVESSKPFKPKKSKIASFQFGICESHGNDALLTDISQSTAFDLLSKEKLGMTDWTVFPCVAYGNGFTAMAKAGSLTVPPEIVENLIYANMLSVLEYNENVNHILISSCHGGISHLKAAEKAVHSTRLHSDASVKAVYDLAGVSGVFDHGPAHLDSEVFARKIAGNLDFYDGRFVKDLRRVLEKLRLEGVEDIHHGANEYSFVLFADDFLSENFGFSLINDDVRYDTDIPAEGYTKWNNLRLEEYGGNNPPLHLLGGCLGQKEVKEWHRSSNELDDFELARTYTPKRTEIMVRGKQSEASKLKGEYLFNNYLLPIREALIKGGLDNALFWPERPRIQPA